MKKVLGLNFLFLIFCLNIVYATPIPTTTPTPISSETFTQTPTPSSTSTNTLVPTFTYTVTVTETTTIAFTPTVTPTPIPMYASDKVYAYPNPARGIVNIVYPMLPDRTVTKVRVLLHAISGTKVAEITEASVLNGIVTFNIDKIPTGVYFYRVIVNYADNTEIKFDYDRLAIIK
jgi:hypothetical protein